MTSDVVLVGGLWVPAAIMLWMGARLGRAGFTVHRFAYSGRDSFEDNCERLARFARGSCAGAAHFVGHSLGGVLIHDLLARDGALRAGRVVLVGAPVRGCLAGRRFGTARIGRWMLGGSAARWQACEPRWRRPEALGVIAGTLPVGLGRLLGALPVSSRVGDLTARFLRQARFS